MNTAYPFGRGTPLAVALLTAVAVVFSGPGCATTSSRPTWNRTGDPVVDGRTAIEQGPARDRVLWEYRTAVALMRRGRFDQASMMFDDALSRIGGILTDDASARKARRLFDQESTKTFIGEPYERAMAYFYRGILYWMEGEPDNARACYRSAQLVDADTENREYRSDYVLFDYLDGYVSTILGGDGTDALKRAREAARLANPPEYDPRANVLIFAEMGQGPTKYGSGEYGEQLRFKPGRSRSRTAVVTIGGTRVTAPAYDDLTYQATTRGGRVMDHVLANKAVFKATTDTIGDAALISGVVLAQNRNSQEVGLGLLAAGLVSKIVSASTTPRADTRQWDNLPQYLGFAFARVPSGTHTVLVEFLDASNSPIPGLTQTHSVVIGNSRSKNVLFISDQHESAQNL